MDRVAAERHVAVVNDKTPTGRYGDNVVPATPDELRSLLPLVHAKPVTTIEELSLLLKGVPS